MILQKEIITFEISPKEYNKFLRIFLKKERQIINPFSIINYKCEGQLFLNGRGSNPTHFLKVKDDGKITAEFLINFLKENGEEIE